MARPPPGQVGRPRPQRAVARGGEPERRFERASEVRLIGKSRLTRHVDEWALLMDPVPREGEPTHEQVTMGARTQHDPELAGEVVASQSSDRLELRRMHDAGSLRIEEAAGALDRGDVDAWSRRRSPPALRRHQSFGELDDEAIDRE